MFQEESCSRRLLFREGSCSRKDPVHGRIFFQRASMLSKEGSSSGKHPLQACCSRNLLDPPIKDNFQTRDLGKEGSSQERIRTNKNPYQEGSFQRNIIQRRIPSKEDYSKKDHFDVRSCNYFYQPF
jgi:hypothetical protein